MSTYNKLLNNLDKLKLEKFKTYLPNFIDEISNNNLSFTEAMFKLTEKEVEFRDERASKIQISVSAFPFEKTLEDFDFGFQPSVNKQQLLDLESLGFVERKENILFFGSSGVGKSHLAVSLGIAAAKKRVITYFITAHNLAINLKKAYDENRLEDKLKHYSKYKVLIIDEIGYLPIGKLEANLLFQLINRRYEKNSTIITTNQPFSKWGEIFSDNTIANAILDRLIHHSHIIKITGPSYRLKDKLELITAKNQNN